MNSNITQCNFSEGMSNIPSDSICSDDSLAMEWNMIYRNGEHHVIQDPVKMYEKQDEENFKYPYLVYIHNFNNKKRGIAISENKLVWFDILKDEIELKDLSIASLSNTEVKAENILGITSLGQTLILSLSFNNGENTGLYYLLWKDNELNYKFLGNELPKPTVKFMLRGGNSVSNSGDIADMVVFSDKAYIKDENQNDYNNFIIGLFEKNKVDICQKKGFHSPFFIRYALELFDGSYARISTPILMFPSVTMNSYGETQPTFVLYTKYENLYYNNLDEIKEWNDIIKGITVFVSKHVDIYDTGVDQTIYKLNEGDVYYDGVFIDTWVTNTLLEGAHYYRTRKTPSLTNTYKRYDCLKEKDETEIINELKSTSVFYKLFNIPLTKTDSYKSVNSLFQTHDLENLVTLPQLDHDDYYGNCPLSSELLYMYNRRLHLTGMKRGFFEGSISFTPLNTIEYTIIDRVSISTNEGDKIVLHRYKTRENPSLYFYYPDSRAFKVQRCIEVQAERLGIIRINGILCEFDLKPHPLLNGAYYMRDTLPNESDNTEWRSETDIEYVLQYDESFYEQNANPELLANQIWQSEVNNPFSFNASGVTTVGNGTVKAIVSNTTALSQSAYGAYPLFAFSTDGIWALELSSTGTYSSVVPISREICNNINSIVATDKLIFFSSEKGLMSINGTQVDCVSTQLSGKAFYPEGDDAKLFYNFNVDPSMSFNEFLKSSKIAYDYRDSLLWIVNEKMAQCFVFSIESGAIAVKPLNYPIINIINDYPDNILIGTKTEEEKTSYFPYSLIKRNDINDDLNDYSSFVISRPMKLGDSTALKTLMEHRLIFNTDEASQTIIRVYGSEDMKGWSKVNSFFGRGFKFFKYQIIFKDIKVTDTFSGIVSRWKTKFQRRFR